MASSVLERDNAIQAVTLSLTVPSTVAAAFSALQTHKDH